ncbi:MAG: SgcJ/EcaC family oxidoreductase [Mariniblastus sp.]
MKYKTKTILNISFCLIVAFVSGTTNAQDKSAQQDTAPSTADMKPSNIAATEIESILTTQTAAWNAGDLERFMATYWKSPNLTFSSNGRTARGWKQTFENYKKNYGTPEAMGKLNFDGLEVSLLGKDAALVLGQWHLKMADDSKKDGNFSLVVKRMEGGWKIIHDHSSIIDDEKETDSPEETSK